MAEELNFFTSIIQKILGNPKKSPQPNHIKSQNQDITFALDIQNSNQALGSDNSTIVSLEYNPLPSGSYIRYCSHTEKIVLCFDDYHNGSCSVFINKDQLLSQLVIDNLKKALIAMGFKDTISFTIL